MGNCLVTKLRESVNNDNLIKLGSMNFYSDGPYGRFNFVMTQASPITLNLVGDGYFSNDSHSENYGKQRIIPANSGYQKVSWVSNGKTKVEVLDVDYNTVINIELNDCYGDFNDYLKYRKFSRLSDNADTGYKAKTYINFDNLEYPEQLTYIYLFSMPNVTGDISFLSNCPDVSIVYIFTTNMYGDIGSVENIGEHLTDGLLLSRNPDLRGSIEGFLIMLQQNGCRCSTMFTSFYGTQCTLNSYAAPPDGSLTITENDITLVNRSTGDLLASYDGSTWTYGSWS